MSDTIPVGPHTKQLMDKIAAEGNQSATYTEAEKMALVADGMMDPKAVGLTSAEEAHLQIMPEVEAPPKFGNEIFLQGGVVPIYVRAEWAYQEAGIIIPPSEKDSFISDWIAKNKNTYRIQCGIRCGTLEGRFERTFKDPVLGLCQMLHVAGEMLEAKYTGSNMPSATDNSVPPTAQIEQPQPAIDTSRRTGLAGEIESAWVIIANAGGGDWSKESQDWQDAAAKWRDRNLGIVNESAKSKV